MLENVGKMLGKSGPLERAELANQIQGFRIPECRDASEKNKLGYCVVSENIHTLAMEKIENSRGGAGVKGLANSIGVGVDG